jgi:hypothetical protein
VKKDDTVCREVVAKYDDHIMTSDAETQNHVPHAMHVLQVNILSSIQKRVARKPLMHLLRAHHIDFDPSSKLDKLRRILRKYIITLEKGKQKTLNRIERDV